MSVSGSRKLLGARRGLRAPTATGEISGTYVPGAGYSAPRDSRLHVPSHRGAAGDDLAAAVDEGVHAAARAPVRFLLSVEVSSIYKRGERVRKVHNLLYAPDFETAARIASRQATSVTR